MEIPTVLLLLLPLSLAAGVDLYLTLLAVVGTGVMGAGVVGAATIPAPIGTPILLGLAILYCAEAVADLQPVLALGWHNLQLLLRPFGGVLLGSFLLQGEPLLILLLGVAMAGVVAAFSHVLFWGHSLVLRLTSGHRFSPVALNAASDFAVVLFLGLTSVRPDAAVFLATVLLGLGLLFGHSRHGAVRFGLALLVDRVWGIVSPTEWREAGDLPAKIRTEPSLKPLGNLRGARAAIWGIVGPRRFRGGWILQRDRELFFAYRRARGYRVLPIGGRQEEVEVGPLSKVIRYFSPEGARSALFLQMGLNGPESHK